jgi:hypothetical protein
LLSGASIGGHAKHLTRINMALAYIGIRLMCFLAGFEAGSWTWAQIRIHSGEITDITVNIVLFIGLTNESN